MIDLRTYIFLDSLQLQMASFLSTISRGYYPVGGQTCCVVEIAPGIEINRLTDIALKATNVAPGLQIVERSFGLLEVHSDEQADASQAGEAILRELGKAETDRLKPRMLTSQLIRNVTDHHAQLINKTRYGNFVGKAPQFIAQAIGLNVPDTTKLLLCEVGREHPLVWTEQLMPVIPLVRMPNVDDAIDLAVQCEHGFRHTAIMHSLNIAKLSKMAKFMNCSIFVKNGPCYAGLGQGGAGFTSFTIASPTGDGLTRARTFTRERRCTLVDYFRIV